MGSGTPGANRANKRPNPSADSTARIPTKRKPGPLPRDFIIRRPSILDSSPPSSPAPVLSPSPVPW